MSKREIERREEYVKRVRMLVQSKSYEELELIVGQGPITSTQVDHERRIKELVEELKQKDLLVEELKEQFKELKGVESEGSRERSKDHDTKMEDELREEISRLHNEVRVLQRENDVIKRRNE